MREGSYRRVGSVALVPSHRSRRIGTVVSSPVVGPGTTRRPGLGSGAGAERVGLYRVEINTGLK